MWLLLHYIYIIFNIFCAIVSSEVITLIKNENIACVRTGDSINSGLYISPYDATSDKLHLQRINDNRIEIKPDDTWMSIDRTTDFQIVTDERWTGFPSIESLQLNTNLAFSICVNLFSETSIIISNKHGYTKNVTFSFDNIPEFDKDICQWEHYILKYQNNRIVFKNIENEIIYKVDMEPNKAVWVNFPEDKIYKIHQYNFFYSNSISLEKSHVDIPSTRCISMYVSIDEKCYLNITLESATSAERKILKHEQIVGFNKINSLKTWKKYEIRSDNRGDQMRLGLSRGCYGNLKEGYWAIDDVKICDPETVVYKSKLNAPNSTDYVCRTLDSKNELAEVSCEAPMIGKNCNISCSSILGPQYSNCEGHKICLEKNCQCAWGYHGKNCSETCGKNKWGLKSEYPQCDPQSGCAECSKRSFGKDDLKKLPVLLYPPELVDVANDSITISFNLEHNATDESPEYYVIQYKILNSAEGFKDYSTFGYSEFIKNNTIKMNLTRNNSYKIRILLLVNGRSFVDDIPNLIVYKTSLNVTNDDDKHEIKVSWIKPNNEDNKYVIKYTCFSMCSSVSSIEGTNETEGTTLNIKKSRPFDNCSIELFTKTNKTDYLIDKITVTSTTLTEKIQKEELPKNVTLTEQILQMKLNNCSYFSGTLDYYIKYQCYSRWCRNHPSKETLYTLKSYSEIVNVPLKELVPFTTYKIDVIAKRLNQENINRTYFNIKSSLEEFHKVMNLSVYSIENDTLFIRWMFIRWKDPARLLKKYKIVLLDDRKNVINVTSATKKCLLWDSFTCASISGMHDMSNCSVLVFARKADVDTWIEPNIIENIQTVTKVPENLQLHSPDSSNYNEVILTWEHPLFTYGKLDGFVIEIDDGKNIITFFKNITSYSKQYNQTITVDFGKNYNISVWVSNKCDGKKAYVFLMVSEPIDEFWGRPFLIWCLKTCYLTLPYQEKVVNFTIQQEGKTLNSSCADKRDCKTKKLVYEIKDNREKTQNAKFNLNLVYNNKTKFIHFETSLSLINKTNKSVYFSTSSFSSELPIPVIILSVLLACSFSVLVCLLFGIAYHAYRNNVFPVCKKGRISGNEFREESSLLKSN